jgi:hypothetical protein
MQFMWTNIKLARAARAADGCADQTFRRVGDGLSVFRRVERSADRGEVQVRSREASERSIR